MDSRSFQNVLVPGRAQEIAEATTLDLFMSKLAQKTIRRSFSNPICERILQITEPDQTPVVLCAHQDRACLLIFFAQKNTLLERPRFEPMTL